MDLYNKIKQFLESEKDILRLPMYALCDYNTMFSTFGYANDGNWELYGWEGYFKIKYDNYNLHKLELSGSLFYGDYELRKV